MSRHLVTQDARDGLVDIWKYLSANGKVFIAVYEDGDTSSIYTEVDSISMIKTVRVFMDSQYIQVYLMDVQKDLESRISSGDLDSLVDTELKTGVTPVKKLQEKLAEVYGKDSKDDYIVECVLTGYDQDGNMRKLDTLWTQNNN